MIIALSGKKSSGKDTVANYLCDKYEFVNYGFADPIKEISKIMFGFSEDQLNGYSKDIEDKIWGIAPRDFFQKFGTDIAQFELPKYFPGIFRNLDKRTIWVRVFELWYTKKLKENPKIKIVISDLRFQHEYEYLKKLDSYFIRIKRNDKEVNNYDLHKSETELDIIKDNEFNHIIENNSSIEDLYLKIDELIR